MIHKLGKLIFIYILAFFIATPGTSADEPFIWLDDIDYAPFISYGEDQKPKGLFVDVIQEVFRRIEVPLKIKLYPWKRTQVLVKFQKGDGMLTVPTPERKSYLIPTDTVFKFTWKLFTHRDNRNLLNLMRVKNLSELKPYQLVTYAGNGWAIENLKNLNVRYAPTLTNALKILVKRGGRVDAIIEHDFIIRYNLKRFVESGVLTSDEVEKIIENPQIFEQVNFTFLIRKESEFIRIIPAFNQALSDMKNDGAYDAIQAKYALP